MTSASHSTRLYPLRLAESRNWARTGLSALARISSGTAWAPMGEIINTPQSPMTEAGVMTISSQATAIIEPAEMACVFTQPTV